jgi:hypothetical protein
MLSNKASATEDANVVIGHAAPLSRMHEIVSLLYCMCGFHLMQKTLLDILLTSRILARHD